MALERVGGGGLRAKAHAFFSLPQPLRWVINADEERDHMKLMDRLCQYIYGLSGPEIDRLRVRAMLCHVYHYALCDK